MGVCPSCLDGRACLIAGALLSSTSYDDFMLLKCQAQWLNFAGVLLDLLDKLLEHEITVAHALRARRNRSRNLARSASETSSGHSLHSISEDEESASAGEMAGVGLASSPCSTTVPHPFDVFSVAWLFLSATHWHEGTQCLASAHPLLMRFTKSLQIVQLDRTPQRAANHGRRFLRKLARVLI